MPWERNIPRLIAVVLDIESVLVVGENDVEAEGVCVESLEVEAGKWNGREGMMTYKHPSTVLIPFSDVDMQITVQ